MVFNRRFRILWHVIFWLVYVLNSSLALASYYDNYHLLLITLLINLPVKMLATYFTLYVLLPTYLYKKEFWSFAFVSLIAAFAFCSMNIAIQVNYTIPTYYAHELPVHFFMFKHYARNFFSIYIVVTLAVAVKMVKKFYEDQDKINSLTKDKLEIELDYLKTQIHPHFLFNTLNNLYAHTLKQSKDSPEIVAKLSSLLSYMLYDCKQDFVPLRMEIDHISDYVELEKMRYGERLEFEMTVTGITPDLKIAPMLLVPLVENGFKHGVGAGNKKGWLHIEIEVKNGQFTAVISNNLGRKARDSQMQSGIGLNNVLRRLNIIYPGQSSLVTEHSNEAYTVKLNVNLNTRNDESNI